MKTLALPVLNILSFVVLPVVFLFFFCTSSQGALPAVSALLVALRGF